jgi:hypothetical protein
VTRVASTTHHGRMGADAGPKLGAVVGSTLAGTFVGACAAGLLLAREWSYNGPDLSIPIILSLYLLDAALVVVCALVALYLRPRLVPDIRSGVVLVGLGLIAGGILGLALAIPFASSLGYSDELGAQEAEVVLVAACCVLGIAAGAYAWLSTRHLRTPQDE